MSKRLGGGGNAASTLGGLPGHPCNKVVLRMSLYVSLLHLCTSKAVLSRKKYTTSNVMEESLKNTIHERYTSRSDGNLFRNLIYVIGIAYWLHCSRTCSLKHKTGLYYLFLTMFGTRQFGGGFRGGRGNGAIAPSPPQTRKSNKNTPLKFRLLMKVVFIVNLFC